MTIENSKLTSDVTLEHLGPSSRQKWITEYILERGSLEVDELSEQFQVSRMTIHRDLDELEKQGVLRKSRGGATVHPSYLFESDIRFRLNAATAEKEAIARFASSLVEPGQVILLDDSTTTIALAQHLKHIKPLTVITNCLHIMEIMHEEHDIRLIALGGDYLPRFDAFTGIICEKAINSLRANLLFMSVSAVSRCVAYHQEQEIVKVKQAMMNSSAEKILLVDHTKFGKVALHHLSPLEKFNQVLIDSRVEKKHLVDLKNAQISYRTVDIS
jgi:DeoR/GlpR family transcriptional regulator of sugar metabolism